MPAITAATILDREFLILRAKILELAAAADRLERAEGDVSADARYQKLLQGLVIAAAENNGKADRAERLQLLFSRPFENDWQARMEISGGRKGQ